MIHILLCQPYWIFRCLVSAMLLHVVTSSQFGLGWSLTSRSWLSDWSSQAGNYPLAGSLCPANYYFQHWRDLGLFGPLILNNISNKWAKCCFKQLGLNFGTHVIYFLRGSGTSRVHTRMKFMKWKLRSKSESTMKRRPSSFSNHNNFTWFQASHMQSMKG